MENPIKMDDWGPTYFWKGNIPIPPLEKENHLHKSLGIGFFVSSKESMSKSVHGNFHSTFILSYMCSQYKGQGPVLARCHQWLYPWITGVVTLLI